MAQRGQPSGPSAKPGPGASRAATAGAEGEGRTGGGEIPPLLSITPAIFVPLAEPVLDPAEEPPRTRIQRIQRIIRSIDDHEKGVRENMMWLFGREKQRILDEARRAEAWHGAAPQDAAPGVDPREADAIIASMSTPADPDKHYNVTDVPRPLHVAAAPGTTLREDTVRRVMETYERAVQQLQGYGGHVQEVRQVWLERLERELERDDRMFVDR